MPRFGFGFGWWNTRRRYLGNPYLRFDAGLGKFVIHGVASGAVADQWLRDGVAIPGVTALSKDREAADAGSSVWAVVGGKQTNKVVLDYNSVVATLDYSAVADNTLLYGYDGWSAGANKYFKIIGGFIQQTQAGGSTHTRSIGSASGLITMPYSNALGITDNSASGIRSLYASYTDSNNYVQFIIKANSWSVSEKAGGATVAGPNTQSFPSGALQHLDLIAWGVKKVGTDRYAVLKVNGVQVCNYKLTLAVPETAVIGIGCNVAVDTHYTAYPIPLFEGQGTVENFPASQVLVSGDSTTMPALGASAKKTYAGSYSGTTTQIELCYADGNDVQLTDWTTAYNVSGGAFSLDYAIPATVEGLSCHLKYRDPSDHSICGSYPVTFDYYRDIPATETGIVWSNFSGFSPGDAFNNRALICRAIWWNMEANAQLVNPDATSYEVDSWSDAAPGYPSGPFPTDHNGLQANAILYLIVEGTTQPRVHTGDYTATGIVGSKWKTNTAANVTVTSTDETNEIFTCTINSNSCNLQIINDLRDGLGGVLAEPAGGYKADFFANSVIAAGKTGQILTDDFIADYNAAIAKWHRLMPIMGANSGYGARRRLVNGYNIVKMMKELAVPIAQALPWLNFGDETDAWINNFFADMAAAQVGLGYTPAKVKIAYRDEFDWNYSYASDRHDGATQALSHRAFAGAEAISGPDPLPAFNNFDSSTASDGILRGATLQPGDLFYSKTAGVEVFIQVTSATPIVPNGVITIPSSGTANGMTVIADQIAVQNALYYWHAVRVSEIAAIARAHLGSVVDAAFENQRGATAANLVAYTSFQNAWNTPTVINSLDPHCYAGNWDYTDTVNNPWCGQILGNGPDYKAALNTFFDPNNDVYLPLQQTTLDMINAQMTDAYSLQRAAGVSAANAMTSAVYEGVCMSCELSNVPTGADTTDATAFEDMLYSDPRMREDQYIFLQRFMNQHGGPACCFEAYDVVHGDPLQRFGFKKYAGALNDTIAPMLEQCWHALARFALFLNAGRDDFCFGYTTSTSISCTITGAPTLDVVDQYGKAVTHAATGAISLAADGLSGKMFIGMPTSILSNASVTSIALDGSGIVGSVPNMAGMTGLTSFTAPNNKLDFVPALSAAVTQIFPASLVTLNLNANTFAEWAVDRVLAGLVAAGAINGTANLAGVGNASPSATGASDVATLTSRGWTVTTN